MAIAIDSSSDYNGYVRAWQLYNLMPAAADIPNFPFTSGAGVISPTALAAYTYSDNPALQLANLETNTVYGASGVVDWVSIKAAADACDALVGGEKRRIGNLVVDDPKDISDWREALRVYAGCFLTRDGAKLKLIPDRPGSSVYSFNETTQQIRVGKVQKRSRRDVPTVCMVRWTDTSQYPWRDGTAFVYAPGVIAGTTAYRIRELALPGVQSTGLIVTFV